MTILSQKWRSILFRALLPQALIGVWLCIPNFNLMLAVDHGAILGMVLFPAVFLWAIFVIASAAKAATPDEKEETRRAVVVGGVSYILIAAVVSWLHILLFGRMTAILHYFALFFLPISWPLLFP